MKKQINSNELLRIPVRPNACINGLYVSVMRCSRLLNAMRHSYIQSLSTASASSPVASAMDAASSPICLRFLATDSLPSAMPSARPFSMPFLIPFSMPLRIPLL